MQYTLGNAAIARGFAPYFGELVNQGPGFLTFQSGSFRIDFVGMGLVIACSSLLFITTGGGAKTNNCKPSLGILQVQCGASITRRVLAQGTSKRISPCHNRTRSFGDKSCSHLFFSILSSDMMHI